ncbi:MAG: NAD(P)-dependent oxidoreductase [Pseudomonadota bacterium]
MFGSKSDETRKPDVAAGRLDQTAYAANFDDLYPALGPHEAHVEADRCYFCHDAPCVTACPTDIDIPLFIRQIQADNRMGAGKTILDSNIFGGMCARVCPTETLCEEVCVREIAEGKPVKIGQLQRFATDPYIETGEHPYTRAPSTGRKVAIVGGGPAGLACAHRLAMLGHDVTVFEAREKLGGLNEYGIAQYKAPHGFAEAEVDWLMTIGGITAETGKALGRDITLPELREHFDAVFLGLGLAGVNALGIEGEDALGVADAVTFIADLRQANDFSALPMGRKVVVIGGGMTAVDAAVQSKRLGAEDVTIVYRRAANDMPASAKERKNAQTNGVTLKENAMPVGLVTGKDGVTGIRMEYTRIEDGRVRGTGETFDLPADMVFKAIGQTFLAGSLGDGEAFTLEKGRIVVDDERRTTVPGVWAGGDCAAGGEDLTVVAVEDGKQAAISIDKALAAKAAVAA